LARSSSHNWLVAPVGVAILATHRPRAEVQPVDLGKPYEQVTLRTSDGLDLAAWYVPSSNGAAVISYPTRQGKLAQARMLVQHGYGVLLVDARGYDGSEGDPNIFGWDDAKDIDAAVAWLQNRRDVKNDRIGGIGFSVGGEMMLQAAATNTGLRAVVSEGAGFRSVREDVLRGPRGWFALPAAAVQSTALAVMSGTPPPPALDDLVGRIAPRAVFFIYSGTEQEGRSSTPTTSRLHPSLRRCGRSTRPGMLVASPRGRKSTNSVSSASLTARCSGSMNETLPGSRQQKNTTVRIPSSVGSPFRSSDFRLGRQLPFPTEAPTRESSDRSSRHCANRASISSSSPAHTSETSTDNSVARPAGPGRLYFCVNRGSEVYAANETGLELLYRREATPEEESALDEAATRTVAELERRGLTAAVCLAAFEQAQDRPYP
jgi:pimeloyl-ACP methyl ester carboxylesterase